MDKLRKAMSPLPNSDKSENVRVGLRIKPSSTPTSSNSSPWDIVESSSDTLPYIKLDSKYCERFKKPKFGVNLDAAFENADNYQVYLGMAKDLVLSSMEGYNGTVFAYGQTSSGKTHTMMGTEDDPGIIPQAVDEIFKYIKKGDNDRHFLLRVSYVEIYNETIKDLLMPETEDLRIHEDKIRGVYIAPLKEVIVTSPKQVMKVIETGEANRHVATNDYHEHSSRSHTLFQILIESRRDETKYSQSRKHMLGFSKKASSGVKFSQLNLIDLAGSEKNTSDGERRKEAAFINKSLLTLGSVISKIADNKGGHIPYRDSKLTRVLQTALSGNSRISVILTLNSAGSYVDESISTLKFGSRIKTITVRASKNPIKDGKALIQKYTSEIQDLKVKLSDTNNEIEKSKTEEIEALKQKNQQYEEEVMELHLARTAYKERIDHLTKLILSSSSMGDKIFKRSRPLSVHISNKDSVLPQNRLSFINKHRDRNERLDWVLEDLKFKNRYIQALEGLLDSLNPEQQSSSQETNAQLYNKYLDIRNKKNDFEDDAHAQSQQQSKAMEAKVSSTLGRVASMRLSRQMSKSDNDVLSALNMVGAKLPFDPTRDKEPSFVSSLSPMGEGSFDDNALPKSDVTSPSPEAYHTPTQIPLTLPNSQAQIQNPRTEADITEMEELIEDQNRIILELEQERKLQAKQVTDLKDRVKRLELSLFKRAEMDASLAANKENDILREGRSAKITPVPPPRLRPSGVINHSPKAEPAKLPEL